LNFHSHVGINHRFKRAANIVSCQVLLFTCGLQRCVRRRDKRIRALETYPETYS